MTEYINREELITACQKKHFAVSANDHPYDVVARVGKYFRQCVDEAPAADVVPKSEIATEIFIALEQANVVRLTGDYWRIKFKYTEGSSEK